MLPTSAISVRLIATFQPMNERQLIEASSVGCVEIHAHGLDEGEIVCNRKTNYLIITRKVCIQ